MAEIIKKRSIKVSGMSCESCEKRIELALSKKDGIKQVKADKKGTVEVEYDLMKIKQKTVEEEITRLGYKIQKKLFDICKKGFIDFMEQNEYDNMKQEASPCCSNPDKILNKK